MAGRLDSAGSELTSTATTDVFSLPSNITNITIMCDDNGDAIGAESAVLIVNGMLQINFKTTSINFVIIHGLGFFMINCYNYKYQKTFSIKMIIM